MDTQAQKIEHRRYPRLHQAFPVKFQLLDENGEPKGEIYEGFTRNVSKGGMSIESRLERKKEVFEFVPGKTKLKLCTSILADAPPVDSIATIKWSTKVSEPAFDVYFFGIEYDQIDGAQQQMIEKHVNRLRRKRKFFLYFFLLSAAFIIVFAYMILVPR